MAAAEQVLTTQVPRSSWPNDPSDPAIGAWECTGCRGRDEQLHVCEILWRGETAQMTVVAPKIVRGPLPELDLQLGDETVLSLKAASNDSMSLGRGAECTLGRPQLLRIAGPRGHPHAGAVASTWTTTARTARTSGPTGSNEIFVHRDQALAARIGTHSLWASRSRCKGSLDIEYRTRYEELRRCLSDRNMRRRAAESFPREIDFVLGCGTDHRKPEPHDRSATCGAGSGQETNPTQCVKLLRSPMGRDDRFCPEVRGVTARGRDRRVARVPEERPGSPPHRRDAG